MVYRMFCFKKPGQCESQDIRSIPVESDNRRFLADRVFSFTLRILGVQFLTRLFRGSLNASFFRSTLALHLPLFFPQTGLMRFSKWMNDIFNLLVS